jgi:hypothetical protein
MCYPRIDTFRVEKADVGFKFTIDGVPGSLLSDLADKAGDQAHLYVKKTGASFGVTITSIPREDATGLLRQLRPDDLNMKLPD